MSYKIGVAGLRRGFGLARMFELMPDCKVTAICDTDAATLERCKPQFADAETFTDFEAMLSHGLDIAVVATPIPVHAEQTVAALAAGCHVLQEVTLADTLDGCRAILDAVKRHPKQKFMLAENCCYWAHILSWQKLWEQGLCGEFMYAEAEYVQDVRGLLRNPDGSPTWRARRPGITYCTHSLGPILKVTGERCVTACCLDSGSKLEPDLNHSDVMVAILQTSSGGVIKLLRGQAVARRPAFHYYSIYGTKGCLETSRPPVSPLQTNAWFEGWPHLQNMVEIPLTTDVPGAPSQAGRGGHGTAEYYMVSDFMDCIRNDAPPPIDIYAALEMTLPGLCAHESATRGGEPVLIPEWRAGNS